MLLGKRAPKGVRGRYPALPCVVHCPLCRRLNTILPPEA
jgi:hypothetical protein